VKKYIPSVQICVDREVDEIPKIIFAVGDMGLEEFLKEMENKEVAEKSK